MFISRPRKPIFAIAPFFRLLGPLLICGGLAATASATDYSASVLLNGISSYNDNLRMTERDKSDVYKFQLAPVASFSADTETSKLALRSTLYFNRYTEDEFNSDDQDLSLDYSNELEHMTYGISGMIQRNSTVTSETLTSGLIGETAERTERYQATPYISYMISETDMLQLQGTYFRQDYRSIGYAGYDGIDSSLDWTHILDERWKTVVSVKYSDYQWEDTELAVPPFAILGGVQFNPATGQFERPVYPAGSFGQQSYSNGTKETGFQLGVDYQWTEQSKIEARVGNSESKTTYSLNDPQHFCDTELVSLLVACSLEDTSDRLSTAQLSWDWKNERHNFSLSGLKSTTPSSNGYVVDATTIFSSYGFRLTERDQLGANVSLVRNRTINDQNQVRNSSIGNRDYQSGTVSYRRELTEEWFVNASYQYNHQKYLDVDYEASSRIISLGITYQPRGWHWAR